MHIKHLRIIFLLAVLSIKVCTSASAASTAKLQVGSFKDFAIASDASSLSQDYPGYKKLLPESAVYIVPKPLRTGDGYARVYCDQSQTSFDIPFGWLVWDTWGGTYCVLPDFSALIKLTSGGGVPFSEAREKFRTQVGQMGCKFYDLADGGFYFKGITTSSDSTNPTSWKGKMGLIAIYTPHPHRPDEWKTATLKCGPDQLDKYEALLGAILQSRDITWDQGWSYAEEYNAQKRNCEKARTFEPTARRMGAYLIKGDWHGFSTSISQEGIAKSGGLPALKKNVFEPSVAVLKGAALPQYADWVQGELIGSQTNNPKAEPNQERWVFGYECHCAGNKYRWVDLEIAKNKGKTAFFVAGLKVSKTAYTTAEQARAHMLDCPVWSFSTPVTGNGMHTFTLDISDSLKSK